MTVDASVANWVGWMAAATDLNLVEYLGMKTVVLLGVQLVALLAAK